MTIGKKLATSSFIIWLLFILAVGTASYLSYKDTKLAEETVGNALRASSLLNDFLVQLEKTRRYEKEYFIYIGDAVRKKKYINEWSDSINKINELMADMEGAGEVFLPEENRQMGQWRTMIDFYVAEFRKIIDAYKDKQFFGTKAEEATRSWTVEANAMIQDGKNALKPVFTDVGNMLHRQKKMLAWAKEMLARNARIGLYVSIALAAVVALLLLWEMQSLKRALVDNLNRLTERVRTMNGGNYSIRFEPTGVAELDRLAEELDRTRNQLLTRRNKRA